MTEEQLKVKVNEWFDSLPKNEAQYYLDTWFTKNTFGEYKRMRYLEKFPNTIIN